MKTSGTGQTPPGSGEKGLESTISYVLIVGVACSLLLEIAGLALYWHTYGNLEVSQSVALFIQGRDFFTFIFELIRGAHHQMAAISVMTGGIVVLILTPFIRVVLSVFYFGWEKNYKYALITLFVLVVLVLSLVLH